MNRPVPFPLFDDIRAAAIAAGHPYVFRVLVWRGDDWGVYCHYRQRDPHAAARMAHDMERELLRRHPPADVLVAQHAMPGAPELLADWRACETVMFHDGPEDQHLVPGVAPVPLAGRQIAQEAARRASRRGDAPLPSGGLWDENSRLQQDLF